jgi:hypothetical protein
MKKLEQYANSSKLMEIAIRYGEEKFRFNLYEELVINENKINQEVKIQPSVFGFLGTLRVKLKRTMKDREAEKDKEYARLFVLFKSQKDPDTNRLYPKEVAKEKAIKTPSYQEKLASYLQAEEEWGIIDVCVNSFEQRSFLLQTLSANLRKENS